MVDVVDFQQETAGELKYARAFIADLESDQPNYEEVEHCKDPD